MCRRWTGLALEVSVKRKNRPISYHSRLRRRVLSKAASEEYRDEAARLLTDPTGLDSALAGDMDATVTLCQRNDMGMSHVALAAYWGGTPYDAYRDLLSFGWSEDWLRFQLTVGRRLAFIRRMFRVARFQREFDGKLIIYRGTDGLSPAAASRGWSWTLNRDVACYFAYYAQKWGEPLVLSATVDASDVLYYENNRFEDEIIVGRPVHAVIDPDRSTWLDAAKNYARDYIGW